MPPWLIIWIARIASGERLEKATREDYRDGAAWLVLIPVCFALLMGPCRPLMNGSAFIIWLFFAAMGAVLLVGSIFWARLVPVKLSWILAVIEWPLLVWYFWPRS
jgi:hypothetical protein